MSNFYPYGYLVWMLLCFSLFINWIIAKFGIQPSISDSFYALEEKYGKGSLVPWLFWLFLINISWPLFPLLNFSGFAFFAIAGLVLVGAAAQFRLGRGTEIPHIIGAVGGIMLAFLSIGFVFKGWAFAWLPAYLLSVGFLNLIKIKNYTWWIEIFAFIMIILALFVHAS